MKKLILGLLLFCNVVLAETEFSKYPFYLQQLPGVCGPQEEVQRFAEDHDFIPLNHSLGREGSQPDGQPVFVVTYWVNEDVSQSMATIQTPSGTESCILYISFDMIHNEKELKKGKRTLWQEERYLEN